MWSFLFFFWININDDVQFAKIYILLPFLYYWITINSYIIIFKKKKTLQLLIPLIIVILYQKIKTAQHNKSLVK